MNSTSCLNWAEFPMKTSTIRTSVTVVTHRINSAWTPGLTFSILSFFFKTLLGRYYKDLVNMGTAMLN
jgi:hypothetical protein